MMSDKTTTGCDLDSDKNAAAVQNTLKEENNEMNIAVEETKGELKLNNNNKNDNNEKPSSENMSKGSSIRTDLLTESQKESCCEKNEFLDTEDEHISRNKQESDNKENLKNEKKDIDISEKSNSCSNNDEHEQEEVNDNKLDKEGIEDIQDECKEQRKNTKEEKIDNDLPLGEENKGTHESELVTEDNYKKYKEESEKLESISSSIADEELHAGQGKGGIVDNSQGAEYCENDTKDNNEYNEAKDETEQNEKKNETDGQNKDDEGQEKKNANIIDVDEVKEKLLNKNDDYQDSNEGHQHSKELTNIDDTDINKDGKCDQASEQKVIEDKAERSQDEEINTQEVVAVEANNLDNECNVNSEKRDENEEVKGGCENSFEMDKEQQNKGDLEEKVNPDADVDKQKGLMIDIDSSNNDENEKSGKRDENDEVKKGYEHSIEMEKEQSNGGDLEGESYQDTDVEKQETVNTESDNFVSNEKNMNDEVRAACDNSPDFDKEQQKENELEDTGDNIEEHIEINEEASSEKLPEKVNDVTEKDTEDLSKDFIERKEQTIEDDNDDGNEADEEDEGEKEENDNEKNYQGIMQDENMGDDDEAYGNDEESKDTESRSVNQIVNGKEEDAEDFDDGDDKQSIREQDNEEVNLDKIQEDETKAEADKKEKVGKGCEQQAENDETTVKENGTENGCELENSAGNGEDVKSVPEPDKAQLKNQFQLFSKFGDKSSDGSSIKLSQSDKWFKQAGIIRPRGISTTDTGIAFRKVSKKAPRLSFPTWCQYLEEVAATKKRNVNLIKTKLVECGPPGISGGTKVVKSAAMRRLTAVSAFGGAQRPRVDSPGRVKGKDPIDGTKSGGGIKSKRGCGTGLKKN